MSELSVASPRACEPYNITDASGNSFFISAFISYTIFSYLPYYKNTTNYPYYLSIRQIFPLGKKFAF